jgi:hypothetical protein
MKSKAVLTGLLLLLVFTSFSFKCDGGGSTPVVDTSPYREPAKVAGTIAESIKAMITIKRALAKNGTLKPAENLALTNALLKLNTADKAFVKEINAVRDPVGASASKPKLCVLFAALTTALSEVNNSGILPVGDAGAKGQLAAALTKITSVVPTISGALLCP